MKRVRELTGLTDRRIRYYEQRGMLGPVDRTPTNQRIYEGRQIRQLWEIADYRDMDLRLQEIDALLDPATTPAELEELARQHERAARTFRVAARRRRQAAS